MENKARYVIIFINPKTYNYIYLAYNADINKICYAENPYLPGTDIIGYAKSYIDIQSAKDDIYKLRYHFRDFIKIQTAIALTLEPEIKNSKTPDSIIHYQFNDLALK